MRFKNFFKKSDEVRCSQEDSLATLKLKNGQQTIFFKAGGQWCYLWTPESFRLNNKIPFVIHHHGARGYVKKKRADWLDQGPKRAFLHAVMNGSGCAIAASHACGDHWGNDHAKNANASLLRALERCPQLDTNRLGLMAGGMGGALVWNSVLGPFKGRVKLVAVLQAVASLEAVIREQRFKKVLMKAYGLPKSIPDNAAIDMILPSDPISRLNKIDEKISLPKTAIYHGGEDIYIPSASHAAQLAEALKRAGGEVELVIFPERKHDIYEMGERMERLLTAFFSSL